MRAGMALVAVAALGGCASVPPLARPPGAPSLVYRCPGGDGFTAAYDAEGQKATVTAGGRIYILPQVVSGSGVRYEQGGIELRSKRDWAMLTGAAGGPYADCRTN